MTNRPSSKIIAAIFASCFLFVFFFGGVMYLERLGCIKNDNEPWRASMTSETSEIELSAETGVASVAVRVENIGRETLDSSAGVNVFLSFHILTQSSKTLINDNDRIALPEPIRKNQQKVLAAVLDNDRLKLKPGNYIVEFDLVKEGEFWFAEKDGNTLRIPMVVSGDAK